ncbi:MAG: hypothetical protein K6G94_11930 [Kiritimatiellae bacterium]|nr:hypothetical protein [Kiritimatiellia bacterium]
MMKTLVLLPAFVAVMATASVAADNLFPGGDFDNADKSLKGDALANGGVVSLFVEDANWNRCGRLEISRSHTNEDGVVTYSASAFVGGDGKALGVPVKGDTLYDFSFEVRSETVDRINVKFQEWQSGVWAKDSKGGSTSLKSVYVRSGWSRYKGTFRTHAGATRAALALQMWQSTKYPPVTLKVGDSILFDNVKIEEAHDIANALVGGGDAVATTPVARVKAARSGESFDDLMRFTRTCGADGPMEAKTTVTLFACEKSLKARFICEEPVEVRMGAADNVWSGDVLELHFGPTADNEDRTKTQFAWNPYGAKTALKSGTAMPEWADRWMVKTLVEGKGYSSDIEIPYELLGFRAKPANGEVIAVNACRVRKGERGCWAPVKVGFGEVERFGRFVFGDWNDALRNVWKSDVKVESREAFESAVQKLETERRDAKFATLQGKPFTVARVPMTSDFACPFTPSESFEPAERINVKAAVNEVTGLPIAILNLTDRMEQYVVRLETSTDDPKKTWLRGYNGRYGLEGLEPERVTLREALRFKDTDQAPCTLRFDPLPAAGDVLAIAVPPKEAGVVWIDFDLLDAKPGTYAGRLRVIPLGESAKFDPVGGFHNRQYEGQLQDVPFVLEVRPIILSRVAKRPGCFFQYPEDRNHAKMMIEAGAGVFQLSPWSVMYEYDKDTGVIDLERPKSTAINAVESLRKHVAWAKEFGVEHPTFFVGIGCYDVAMRAYGGKSLPISERAQRFVDFVKAVQHMMNEAGIDDSDYTIETFGEPDTNNHADEVIAAHKATKAACPEVNLTLTMGACRTDIGFFNKIADFTDSWILWDGFYFQQKENLDFNAEQMAKGRSISHYTCSTSPRTPLYREYRLHAWFGECHKLNGNHFYWFEDRMGGYGEPDFKVCTAGGLVYRNFGRTIPSIRYMNLRQGVQDVKYFDKLREIAGDRKEVKEFLEEAVHKVMVTDMHDHSTPDKMREKAAELILKYAEAR